MGVTKTKVIKVFELWISVTGVSEKEASHVVNWTIRRIREHLKGLIDENVKIKMPDITNRS
jgi:hypothetical protein